MSDFNEKENIDSCDEKNNELSEQKSEYANAKALKPARAVSIQSFVVSVIALVLAAVMVTYTVSSMIYRKEISEAYFGMLEQGEVNDYDKLDLVKAIFDRYSYIEINDEAQLEAVIRAYVRETGDRYAVYYNAEEYAAHQQSVAGRITGIGVTVISGTVTVDDVVYAVMNVSEVVADGPADKAGVKVGDKIAWLGKESDDRLVGDMASYSEAVNYLHGKSGTMAEFGVFRENEGGYDKIFFSIEREDVDQLTVYHRVSETDPKVGIVRITRFNYTTPLQYSAAIDSLLASGCENFVFDVRDNPGGSLDSVVAILSYMLPAGTVLLSTIDANGTEEIIKVEPVTLLEGDAASCNVSESELGKYSGKIKKTAVLCDGGSASAAELFAANFRDHSLGILVGEKTYGKGSMQSVLSLAPYGFSGAIKLTTRMYFPPCGEGYDGVGLYPTENYNISLSDEAKKYQLDLLPESLDDQLLSAIRSFE